MSERPDFHKNAVTTERFGNHKNDHPDVVLVCMHDGEAIPFLDAYPELKEAFGNNLNLLHHYLELERDLGSGRLSRETAEILANIAQNQIGIDLVMIKNIPRGVIDPNRVPERTAPGANPSGVHTHPIRGIFDHSRYPELLQEFNEIHKIIYDEVRAAVRRLLPTGLFLDIHTMNDYTPISMDTELMEGPTQQALHQYISRFTLPDFQSESRRVNLLTRFVGQPPIANMELVGKLEEIFKRYSIETEHDRPYSYLDFSTCSVLASENPGRGTTIDYPIRELAEDSHSDNIAPVLSPRKISRAARIQAMAIWATLQAAGA